MRRNTDIFIQTHATHSSRHVVGFDSAVNSGSCAVGYIQGQYRRIPALVVESATEHDHWRIVNLKGQVNGEAHFDAVAVLGAIDDAQASSMALMQFGRMFDAIAMDVLPTTPNGLIRHLDTSHYHTSKHMIQPWQLAALQDVVCAEKPMWDDINLVSHQGQTANLLLDMQRHDDCSDLLTKFDGLPQLLENLGAEEVHFDAIIIQYQYLEKLMGQIHQAMKNAGKAGVQVVNVTQSKPFKRNKVAQVAVTYDLDDGQNVTILFHNPDSTPAKLTPADTLISWKILMNNRDVTGAIQPNQGEGIALPVLAGRILKLVNQNSARFKRTQAKKAETAKALADAEQRITDKAAQEAALDNEMIDLKQQLDKVHEQAKQNQQVQPGAAPEPAPEPIPTPEPAASDPEYTPEQLLTPEELAQAQLEPKPATNPHQEFLQNIIAGTVDATTVDMDYIIELAEKYQDDEAVNALVEQALEVINQAEQSAAQSVA